MSTNFATTGDAQAATSSTASKQKRILVSVLNWNGAGKTLNCVDSLQSEIEATAAEVTVLVIDNGSKVDDFSLVENASKSGTFVLKRLPTNLGFTGGHNIAIQMAIDEGYDFIWLMNNDAEVVPGALNHMLAAILANEKCGAVSPVLRDAEDGQTIARCISTHDWRNRTYTRVTSIDEAQRIQLEHPESVWLDGTAILFRVKALIDTGPLDERLFAYYDDNDIGARLAAKGWVSQCAFAASVIHENRKSVAEYPLYLSYLLQRNEMLFWHANLPSQHRRLLRLKLVDKALYEVNRLYRRGYPEHGDAALLGMRDFLVGKFGAPAHNKKVPGLLRIACKISALYYSKRLAVIPMDSR